MHHRSPSEGFHPAALGQTDEFRVVLLENPSTGFSWEPHFNGKALAMKVSACTYPPPLPQPGWLASPVRGSCGLLASRQCRGPTSPSSMSMGGDMRACLLKMNGFSDEV